MESECLDTIKRVAFPGLSRHATVISKIAEKSLPQKNIIDKTCPNLSDIKVTQKILVSLLTTGSVLFKYDHNLANMRLEMVVSWLKRNPDSPPELIRQYQVVVNVLEHYSLPSDRRPAIRNDGYFFRNVHKESGFSIVGSWTNVKKLLKRRT